MKYLDVHGLPRQLLVLQPLPDYLSHHAAEAISIFHRLAVVVPKRLFVHVPEQMEWSN